MICFRHMRVRMMCYAGRFVFVDLSLELRGISMVDAMQLQTERIHCVNGRLLHFAEADFSPFDVKR